jgi:O-antigen/teichoic acid export membrane protein
MVSSLVREVGTTYVSQVVGSGLGFVIQLLLQRALGPAEYGILSIAVSVGVFAGVLTDVGISHAMIRFGSKWLIEAPGTPRAMAFCAAALRLRLGLALVVSGVGYLSSGWILVTFYSHAHQLGPPLRLVFLTLVAHTLFSYWMFFAQTLQWFGLRSLVTIGASVLRFSSYCVLAGLGQVSVASMIVLDASVSFVAFLTGMQFSPGGILRPPGAELKAAYRELVPYLRYTGILIVGDTIFNELDVLMLGMLSDEATTGLYRTAWTYAMVLGFLAMSVSNVLFPKIASLSDVAAATLVVRKGLKLTSLLAVATLPSLPVVRLWVPWYEPEYAGAVSIFYIMYVGAAFDLVIGPLTFMLFSLNRPDILAKIAIGKVVLHAAGNWILIPMYGAHGAAWASVVTRVLGGLVAVAIMWRTIRRSAANPYASPSGTQT